MDSYGKTFREIRKQKNLTLQYIAKDIMSVSMISKFERDESDVTLSRIIPLLNRMNVTLEEFLYTHNEFKKSEFREKLSLVIKAYHQSNVTIIRKIIEEEEEKFTKTEITDFRMNSLMFEAILSDLTGEPLAQESIDLVVNSLWSLEVWGEYEVTIYGNMIKVLNIESVILLSKEIFKKSKRYARLMSHRADIYGIIFNTIIVCLEKKKIEEATIFLSEVKNSNIPEKFIYERLLFKYLEGLLEITKGNIKNGYDLTDEVIRIFTFTESNSNVTIYTRYLNEFIQKRNSLRPE
ncbi:helix-turn-helix domain-containing protein [Psychrobacillus sp. FSL K6-2836]|uniref:helix-turn-helix domain-containing protein n=1 Tax=Psychrobacillus sp. FSL K6-2836 TaxID=2921548 RepID=UPI0030F6ED9B